jgi:excisionase family DNA binding protein
LKTATAEEVMPAVFPATPENRYLALLILQGEEIPLRIDEPLLISMGEATKILGVSRATLWRMIRAGRLPKIEIYSGAFRLRRADVVSLANGEAVPRD